MLVRLHRTDPGIAVLTLDDPGRRNAMTGAAGDDLAACADELLHEPGPRAVVLTDRPPALSAAARERREPRFPGR